MTGQETLDGLTCDPALPDGKSPVPHDYKHERDSDDYGSLAEGGSYEALRCQRPHCRRLAYRPLPD